EVAPLLADDVRSDGGQLLQEIIEVHHEVLEDREVRERLDRHRALVDIADVGATGEARTAVDIGAARTANAHAAGPTEGEGRIDVVLDVIQAVQDDHVVTIRDPIFLEGGPSARFRAIPLYP